MDEFLQRDPALSKALAQSCHLYAIPALCLSERRIPRKRHSLLAGGAEVQGKRKNNTLRLTCRGDAALKFFLRSSSTTETLLAESDSLRTVGDLITFY